MLQILLFVSSFFSLTQSSIYDFSITTINGDTINLREFQGRKILFINTATNSEYVNQYGELEQLYQQYKDSLVIIAFPSNSFGNEPDSNSIIKDFVINNYNVHYILASKTEVSGEGICPLYQWLTQASQNGIMDNPVQGDFFKYIINKDGNLIGVLDGSTSPIDESLQMVIKD